MQNLWSWTPRRNDNHAYTLKKTHRHLHVHTEEHILRNIVKRLNSTRLIALSDLHEDKQSAPIDIEIGHIYYFTKRQTKNIYMCMCMCKKHNTILLEKQ